MTANRVPPPFEFPLEFDRLGKAFGELYENAEEYMRPGNDEGLDVIAKMFGCLNLMAEHPDYALLAAHIEVVICNLADWRTLNRASLEMVRHLQETQRIFDLPIGQKAWPVIQRSFEAHRENLKRQKIHGSQGESMTWYAYTVAMAHITYCGTDIRSNQLVRPCLTDGYGITLRNSYKRTHKLLRMYLSAPEVFETLKPYALSAMAMCALNSGVFQGRVQKALADDMKRGLLPAELDLNAFEAEAMASGIWMQPGDSEAAERLIAAGRNVNELFNWRTADQIAETVFGIERLAIIGSAKFDALCWMACELEPHVNTTNRRLMFKLLAERVPSFVTRTEANIVKVAKMLDGVELSHEDGLAAKLALYTSGAITAEEVTAYIQEHKLEDIARDVFSRCSANKSSVVGEWIMRFRLGHQPGDAKKKVLAFASRFSL
ncbi:hypothetical protein ACYPKM_05355 [Pseudomonas aeruginosa]